MQSISNNFPFKLDGSYLSFILHECYQYQVCNANGRVKCSTGSSKFSLLFFKGLQSRCPCSSLFGFNICLAAWFAHHPFLQLTYQPSFDTRIPGDPLTIFWELRSSPTDQHVLSTAVPKRNEFRGSLLISVLWSFSQNMCQNCNYIHGFTVIQAAIPH
jgi:hypothetical protein